ncbi:MAG: esterase/lipase family protein [Sporichthyaceae bacterium]
MTARRLLTALAAAALALPVTVLAQPNAQAAPAAGPPRASNCGQVQLAPILKQDFTPDGQKIQPQPDRRGRYVPIIVVPDWQGLATHDEKRTGDFSRFVDMNAAGPPPEVASASVIGQLQQIPGAAVYTFDYRGSAGRWVDDPGIGPALGDAIDCLVAAVGQKAILVTHGLGGVAARYAVAGQIPGRDRGSKVTTVIGYGSPQLGSQIADLTNNGVGRTASEPRALLRLLVNACNALAPARFDPGAPCGFLPQLASALGEGSAAAYRTGSSQLAGLLPYPNTVDIDSFAGNVQVQAPELGWFGLRPFRTDSVSLGDLAAAANSVTASSRNQLLSGCSFTLDAFGTNRQSMGLRLIDAGSPELGPVWGNTVRPCFAPNLPRVADFATSLVGIVTKEIRERRPLEQEELEALPVPSMCGHPAGTLVDGRLPGIAPGAGEVVLGSTLNPERAKDFTVFGDLTSDGVPDTVVVMKCSDAGGAGPDSVLVYDSQATLLGGIGLDRVTKRRDNSVYQVKIAKQKAQIDWLTSREGDDPNAPTVDARAVFSYDVQKAALVPGKLVSYTEVGPASKLFEAVRTGTGGATALSIAPQEIVDAMQATHRSDGAFQSFTCYGPSPQDDWPQAARDSFGQSWPPQDGLRHGERFCLIRLADRGASAPTPSPSPGGTPAPTASASPAQERYVLLGMEHVGFNSWRAVEYRTPGEVAEQPDDDGGLFTPPSEEPEDDGPGGLFGDTLGARRD